MASKICSGSQLLHPKATTSLMALHPKGRKAVHYIPGPLHPKWHYIQKATTSHKPLHPTMLLHPIYHFIPQCCYIPCITSSHNATTSHVSLHPTMLLHPMFHFIPYTTASHNATTSHKPLHPIYHFIPQVTSSQMRLHRINHFIPQVTSSHVSLHPIYQSIPYAAYDMPLYPLATS